MTAFLALTVVFTLFSGNAVAAQNELGGLSPADSLTYMKKTKNLYILDVSPPEKFKELKFDGAVNIPHAELLSRINEIPTGRPVIVHCRLGRTCVKAYPLLKRMRPDIPEISYISAEPLFKEYNDYVRTKM